MEFDYKPRIVDKILANALKDYGAVLIKGPRLCGKTTSAKRIAAQCHNLENPGVLIDARKSIQNNPSSFIAGEKPILFDEWQLEPEIWNVISTAIQENGETGSFILTGSANADMVKKGDNATDTITTVNMWSMSLYESGDSTGEISLSELINNPDNFKSGCISPLSRERLIFLMCCGGWPGSLRINDSTRKILYSRNITQRLLERNLHLSNGQSQDSEITKAILSTFARNNCMLTSNDKLYDDIEKDIQYKYERKKVDMYVQALKNLYVLEDIKSWSTNPLSKKHTKHTLADPSLVASVLEIGPETLEENRNAHIRGLLFECLCIRDIKVYSSAMNFNVGYSFYRGEDNDEVDIVLHDGGKCRALIECKLAQRDIWTAEKNLLELEKKIIENESINTPKNKEDNHILKIIITGTETTEKLKSGVFVIPIGCLKD